MSGIGVIERGKKRTIGLALPPAAIFDLETREVSVRLDFLDEWHLPSEVSRDVKGGHPKSRVSIHPMPVPDIVEKLVELAQLEKAIQ